MIPTVTYDQVRIEQQGRLARLELRQHERAARAHRAEKARTQRVHGHVSNRRAAVALGAVVTAALVLFLL